MNLQVEHGIPKQILTPASGFLSGYSHTLNPYTGCAFACSYCYVRRLPVALFRKQEWGTWVNVKKGAAGLLRKEIVKAKKKGPLTIFMSSSTDPYQPLEYKERITQSLLEVMAEEPPHFLFVQTRSPLVTRDIDLFKQLKDRIRISITVETDRDDIRRAFSPYAPPIAARLSALRQVKDAGLQAQATIAPLLPCTDQFPALLAGMADRVCLDDFFMGDGSGGRRTKSLGIERIFEHINESSWYGKQTYLGFLEKLKQHFPDERIAISQQGFLPPDRLLVQ